MSRDFTLEKYEELCHAIFVQDYEILTVRKYLESEGIRGRVVILRHDVDRKIANALKMARLENRRGICATYYFRKRRHTFKPVVIEEIANLGHEIGYHYEALVKAKGDNEEALALFKEELSEFRKIGDVKTICAHGSPFSRVNNLALWDFFDYRQLGLLGDASLSLDFSQIAYLSDTGRTWDNQRFSVRDRVKSELAPSISTTDELISLLSSGSIGSFCIQVHPERWAHGEWDFLSYALLDFFVNRAKMVVARSRGLSL